MPKYEEKKILPYAPEQLFDLVMDIEQYPDFLPWCIGARIVKREGDIVTADLVIGWKLIREKFRSKVTLTRPTAIHVDYLEGPMRYMRNDWRFTPHANGTDLQFLVDFEFRSRALEMVMGVFFNEAARRMVSAFEERARQNLKPSSDHA
jgi:coenzyme Q-binding protein COQ10